MTAQDAVLLGEITIDDTNDTIIFTEGGSADKTATIAHGTYYLNARSDSLLDAIIAALDAASASYTFSGQVGTNSVDGYSNGNGDDVVFCVWLFATPDPTAASNIVFRWSSSSNTFDPKLIGGDKNGLDLTWYDEGSYTRFFSTHTPSPVFVADAPLGDDDDPKAFADIQTHVSPNNVRSHYQVRSLEKRKTLSWGFVSHDRVHLKTDALNFADEEWGCLETLWSGGFYRGRRVQLYKADHATLFLCNDTDYVGTYVWAEGPPSDFPVRRSSVSQQLYDVGPMVLAPYVSPS